MKRLGALLRNWFAGPAPKPVEPDWASIDSYTQLADAAGQCFWLEPDAFIDGPFRRFLEIASPPHARGRGAARIMEFATGVWHGYSKAAAARGADKAALDARALALVEAHFADNSDGDYLIDVFEGLATHNYGADVPRSVRKAGTSPEGATSL